MAIVGGAQVAIIANQRSMDAYPIDAGINGAAVTVIAQRSVMAMTVMTCIGGAGVVIIADYRGVDAYALNARIARAMVMVIAFFGLEAADTV